MSRLDGLDRARTGWLEWMPRLNAEPTLDEDIPETPPIPVA